jgi:hypothetical protein
MYNFLIADRSELIRLAEIDVSHQLDEIFLPNIEPHKYRKKG